MTALASRALHGRLAIPGASTTDHRCVSPNPSRPPAELVESCFQHYALLMRSPALAHVRCPQALISAFCGRRWHTLCLQQGIASSDQAHAASGRVARKFLESGPSNPPHTPALHVSRICNPAKAPQSPRFSKSSPSVATTRQRNWSVARVPPRHVAPPFTAHTDTQACPVRIHPWLEESTRRATTPEVCGSSTAVVDPGQSVTRRSYN